MEAAEVAQSWNEVVPALERMEGREVWEHVGSDKIKGVQWVTGAQESSRIAELLKDFGS